MAIVITFWNVMKNLLNTIFVCRRNVPRTTSIGLADDHHGRKQSRQGARQHDKQEDRPHPERRRQHVERQPHLQQVIGKRQRRLGEQQPDGKRNDCQEGGLQHQPQEQFHTRRTQEAAGRHLLRPLPGLCHRQVDIVDDRENQDQDADGHQDQ